MRLVSVEFWFVWSISGYSNVFSLFVREPGELGTDVFKMGQGNLFIKLLGKHVDTEWVFVALGPQLNLSKDLVSERVGHDKARMTHGAAKVDETTFS